ncbi:MAG: hypothetical protein C0513_07005 [Isosphaera sp.]|nr:hypothetical protein [Isosphaera sp.]
MTHAGCSAVLVRGLRVVVRAQGRPEPPSPADDPRLRTLWEARRRENPRLHDGPIWSVLATERTPGVFTLTVCPERYSRLVVQGVPVGRGAGGAVGSGGGGRAGGVRAGSGGDEGGGGGGDEGVELGVRLLGAKGFITGTDAAGRGHTLIAQRGPGVRAFPGLWECCPAGAVDRGLGRGVSADDLWGTLIEESDQELGVRAVVGPAGHDAAAIEWGEAVACVACDESRSVDVVIAGRYRGVVDPAAAWPSLDAARAWEVGGVRWVALDAIAALVGGQAATVAPPTRALWAALGLA